MMRYRLRGYVRMYVYPQRLCNTILCSCMYVCHACTTIVQFSGQNGDGPGMITVPDYCLAGLCGLYLMEEHNHKYIKSLPAHCASRTISVTL